MVVQKVVIEGVCSET